MGGVIFVHKVRHFDEEALGGSKLGLRKKFADVRFYCWKNSHVLCASKDAQDSDRCEPKQNGNGAPVRLVDKNAIRVDLQCESQGLRFTGVEIRIARDY